MDFSDPFSSGLGGLLSKEAKGTPSTWGWSPGKPISINFGWGVPDQDVYPVRELEQAIKRALKDDRREALGYGGSYGDQALREAIAAKLSKSGSSLVERQQVMVTSGSSHALALACAAFVDPGDAVIMEAPTYPGSIGIFRSGGAVIRSVPMDTNGMQVEVLEAEVDRLRSMGVRTKLVYVIPNYHNPTGATLSEARRRRLVEIAARQHVVVLEDDAYGDLGFESEPMPSLASLDHAGWVIGVGSFSKTIAPGVRLGWASGSAEAMEAMALVRHDMGSSSLMARTVAELMTSGNLDHHLRAMRLLYRAKRDRMVAALGEYCFPFAQWQAPLGGFFIWPRLAAGIDSEALARAAADVGVGFVPGTAFYSDGGGRPVSGGHDRLRLAFSQVAMGEIDEGVRLLSAACQRVLDTR